MKEFCIFKNYKRKFFIELFDYNIGTFTFQGFLLADNNNKQLEDLHLTCIGQITKDAKIANQFLFPYNKS